LALPLPPFAEQLALGFNPGPAAAVGGGCRYARGGRFALKAMRLPYPPYERGPVRELASVNRTNTVCALVLGRGYVRENGRQVSRSTVADWTSYMSRP